MANCNSCHRHTTHCTCSHGKSGMDIVVSEWVKKEYGEVVCDGEGNQYMNINVPDVEGLLHKMCCDPLAMQSLFSCLVDNLLDDGTEAACETKRKFWLWFASKRPDNSLNFDTDPATCGVHENDAIDTTAPSGTIISNV